jgi:hypothetical protein
MSRRLLPGYRPHEVSPRHDTHVTPGPGRYSPERVHAAIRAPRSHVAREKPSSIYWGPRGAPPSIPMPDQAWGYEEEADGSLVLQQPDPTPFAPGPGSYDPSLDSIKPTAASIDFGAGSGREYQVPEMGPIGSAVSEELAPGDHEGQTANPKPYSPLPSATHPPKLYSSTYGKQRPRYSQTADAPSNAEDPAPGVYEVPPGVGRTRPVPAFPRQRRYQVRPVRLGRGAARACLAATGRHDLPPALGRPNVPRVLPSHRPARPACRSRARWGGQG